MAEIFDLKTESAQEGPMTTAEMNYHLDRMNRKLNDIKRRNKKAGIRGSIQSMIFDLDGCNIGTLLKCRAHIRCVIDAAIHGQKLPTIPKDIGSSPYRGGLRLVK